MEKKLKQLSKINRSAESDAYATFHILLESPISTMEENTFSCPFFWAQLGHSNYIPFGFNIFSTVVISTDIIVEIVYSFLVAFT